MGRETKILLALLATLAGVFFGVLSMKLLVPRPPAGAGPDVTLDVASTGANALVEPPSLSHHAAGPTPTDPAAAVFTEAAPAADSRSSESRFTADQGDLLPPPTPLAVPNAAVPPATLSADVAPTATPDLGDSAAPRETVAVSAPQRDPFVAPAGLQVPAHMPAPRPEPAPAGVAYVASPGDSWWGLAERAYGDGRLYRALFAWNRTLDPRISLAPGTRLDIPPRPRLEAAWPKLMPAQ